MAATPLGRGLTPALAAAAAVLVSAPGLARAEAVAQIKDEAIMPPDMAVGESNFSAYDHAWNENSVEVNGTRYQLTGIRISPYGNKFHIKAETKEFPDRDTLLHPCFVSYWVQCAGAGLATVMVLYAPRSLIALLCAMVLVWPVSWWSWMSICRMEPLSAAWWLMAVKSAIVNVCPVVPMLMCKIRQHSWGARQMQCAGYIVYFVLWANVFWTLFFPLLTDFNFNLVCKANWLCGLSLCASLVLHLIAMRKRGVTLFQVRGPIVYGYGTSLSWLLCYTVWNALFVISLAPGLTLQDILFWCIMFALYYYSERAAPIEDYFAMARPVQLGMYIGLSDWLDLIPYFRVAGVGLDMTRHPYFLFISVFNLVYSFYVLQNSLRMAVDVKYGRNDYPVQSGANEDTSSSGDGLTSGDESCSLVE